MKELLDILKKEILSDIALADESGDYWELPEKIDEIFSSVYEGVKLCTVYYDYSTTREWLSWADMMDKNHEGNSAYEDDPKPEIGEIVRCETPEIIFEYKVQKINNSTIILNTLKPYSNSGIVQSAPLTEIYRLYDNSLVWRI